MILVFAEKYGISPWQLEEECTAEWWQRMIVFEEKLGGLHKEWQEKATSKS